MTRPSKNSNFISIAIEASKRSHDIHTKCGCVLVKDGRIISTGYNGFAKGLNDSKLPLTRPEKYPYIIHSEMNAILNRSHKEVNYTAYVTAEPCFNCLYNLYQDGCSEIIYSDHSKPKMVNTEDAALKSVFFESFYRMNRPESYKTKEGYDVIRFT